MSYHHLTQNERYLIGHIHSFGRSIRQIAKELTRAPGTVSRELKRNSVISCRSMAGSTAETLTSEHCVDKATFAA